MKNHNCPFSNSCKYYTNDNCQGCNYANLIARNSTWGLASKNVIPLTNIAGKKVELVIDEKRIPIRVDNLEITSAYGECDTGKLDFTVDRYGAAKAKFDEAVTAYDVTLRHSLNVPDSAINKIIEDVKKNMNNRPAIGYYKKPVDKSKPGWSIKNVIFNDPATIVFWEDGTKTVVKCENEAFDPEKGLAMALAKKMLGNKGNYFDVFKKWIPEEKED